MNLKVTFFVPEGNWKSLKLISQVCDTCGQNGCDILLIFCASTLLLAANFLYVTDRRWRKVLFAAFSAASCAVLDN